MCTADSHSTVMAAHWFPLKKSALLLILSGDVGLKSMSSWEFLRDNDCNLAYKDLRFSTDPWLLCLELVTRPPYLRCHPLPVQFGRSAGWYRLIGSGLMYAVLCMVWKQPLTRTFSVGMERDLGAYGAVESWETDGHKKNQETLTVTMTWKEKEASFRSTFWTGPWKPENRVSGQEKFSVKKSLGRRERPRDLPLSHSLANEYVGDLSYWLLRWQPLCPILLFSCRWIRHWVSGLL